MMATEEGAFGAGAAAGVEQQGFGAPMADMAVEAPMAMAE